MSYLDKIKEFDENNLLSLDEIVMGALELFEKGNLSSLDISEFKKPLIAGSGNAIVTAKIIFSGIDALFCDETSFDEYIDRNIDGLIIVSASGEKHAIIFAKKAISKGIKTKLLTCNSNSTTGKLLGEKNTTVTLKNREPYTYNTSTYMGWIFALTNENPKKITEFIQKSIDPILKTIDFSKFEGYLLVTPDKFSTVNQLFIVKFIELFGRKIARDVFSYEQLKHAVTVVPEKKEITITFGEGDLVFNPENNIHFPLPNDCNLGGIMAIGYYVIGKVQNSYPHYFKNNIGNYIEYINKSSFGKGLGVIVE